MLKNLPTVQETWAQSLSWEDPLDTAMATHSNILAWRIPWAEEPGRLQFVWLQSPTRLSKSLFVCHDHGEEGEASCVECC